MNKTKLCFKDAISKIKPYIYVLSMSFIQMLIVLYGAIWISHFIFKFGLGR